MSNILRDKKSQSNNESKTISTSWNIPIDGVARYWNQLEYGKYIIIKAYMLLLYIDLFLYISILDTSCFFVQALLYDIRQILGT